MKRFGPAMATVLALAFAGGGICQQMLQYGFEGRNAVWVPGPHDAAYKETLHSLTSDHIHGGQRSEAIQIDAQNGSYIHYTYNLGRAPVTEDFNVSLWVRANRPGVQLLARVVFPKEFDPKNTGQPLTALLPGERYQIAQHWQPLTLPTPLKLLRQQQQLLSNTLKRQIDITDAYVDQLVLNVYSGPGETPRVDRRSRSGAGFRHALAHRARRNGMGEGRRTRDDAGAAGLESSSRRGAPGGRTSKNRQRTPVYAGHPPHRHPLARVATGRLQHRVARRKRPVGVDRTGGERGLLDRAHAASAADRRTAGRQGSGAARFQRGVQSQCRPIPPRASRAVLEPQRGQFALRAKPQRHELGVGHPQCRSASSVGRRCSRWFPGLLAPAINS